MKGYSDRHLAAMQVLLSFIHILQLEKLF